MKRSKLIAVLLLGAMLLGGVQPSFAETWGEWFMGLFGANNSIPQGGAYKDIVGTKPHMEAHHLLPDAVSPFSRGNGPSVLMTPEDHRRTASYGNSIGAQNYRNEISNLVNQRNWTGIWQMIENDMAQFGGKYNPGLEQAKPQYDWETTKMDLNDAIKMLESLEGMF